MVPDQRPATHFVDSAPAHGAVHALVPDKVLINFDVPLGTASSIGLTRNGAPVRSGDAMISGLHDLSLSAPLPRDARDGLYVATYDACRTDGTCERGQLAFVVDSSTRGEFSDMTGRTSVALNMRNVKFDPARIIVSTGTTVTWTNQDPVIHFVNTDPHPSHNNLSDLNSFELKQGDVYAYTFSKPGEWRYHCSAHAGMTGSIIAQ